MRVSEIKKGKCLKEELVWLRNWGQEKITGREKLKQRGGKRRRGRDITNSLSANKEGALCSPRSCSAALGKTAPLSAISTVIISPSSCCEMATNHGHSSGGGGSSTAVTRSAPQLWLWARYSIYLHSHHWMKTGNKICEKDSRSVWWRRGEIKEKECCGRYLDRTYRHGGNEARYTSCLWSKKLCFDCIVSTLFEA